MVSFPFFCLGHGVVCGPRGSNNTGGLNEKSDIVWCGDSDAGGV